MSSRFNAPADSHDAHHHFFPLTAFRFESPVSYWDPNHFGGIFFVLEAVLTAVLTVDCCRQLESKRMQSGVIALCGSYFAAIGYFAVMF